jgi:predicted RNA-binding Zn ribbon-like protein
MYQFELIGERLCLDFCNTRSNRQTPPEIEHLPDYGELLRWAEAARIVTPNELIHLRAAAASHPREAKKVMERAWKLRESFFELLGGGGNLDLINREISEAMAHTRLVREGARFIIDFECDDLAAPLYFVARSMMELLTSSDLERVRMCEMSESNECAWLFLDPTKNHTRRWCSMASCGNRAKARRHYRRKKK